MKKPANNQPKTVVNRRARFDYELGDDFVAGLVLSGPEVRAIRDSRAQLKGAFVTIKDGELWLNNASLSVRPSAPGVQQIAVDTSPRKLLVHKKQLATLAAAKQAGNTIVPTKLLPASRYIKVVIAIAKGKKNYDKRETLKRRDQEREAQRAIKNR
ncbi:MAG TPA: SsrA-binding protein SmpB [Candidatus Saccharimonadales bacterium]|jgi:SsrA-binding protein|nr:SsrA-binding protein SmpB [Candidatus Saccharimonadales bacterium]